MNINIPLTVEIRATSTSTFTKRNVLDRIARLQGIQDGINARKLRGDGWNPNEADVHRELDYLENLLAREFPQTAAAQQ